MAKLSNNGNGRFAGVMSADTRALVLGDGILGEYIQYKIGSMLGKPPDDVLLGTPLRLPSLYATSEGVIKAMTERRGFVPGLRVDLQEPQQINGVRYATFQVQWGTGMDGKRGGAYAGALLRTDSTLSVGDLRSALDQSRASGTYWRVDP